MTPTNGPNRIDTIVLMAFGLFVVGWASLLHDRLWIMAGFVVMFISLVVTAHVAREIEARETQASESEARNDNHQGESQ